MRYVYSVIRFVPDTVRGEFINVGILVGSDKSSEWDIRTLGSLKRARTLDEKGLLPLVWTFIDDIGRQLDRYNEAIQLGLFGSDEGQISEEWLTQICQQSRNVVQFSNPAIIDADDVNAAINALFEQFIVVPEARRVQFKNKHAALAAMRRAYRDAGLRRGQHFDEGANVRGHHHKERFDFVVANGHAVQLTQTWSFQVPIRKSWQSRSRLGLGQFATFDDQAELLRRWNDTLTCPRTLTLRWSTYLQR